MRCENYGIICLDLEYFCGRCLFLWLHAYGYGIRCKECALYPFGTVSLELEHLKGTYMAPFEVGA
jgi:hypothetical protein